LFVNGAWNDAWQSGLYVDAESGNLYVGKKHEELNWNWTNLSNNRMINNAYYIFGSYDVTGASQAVSSSTIPYWFNQLNLSNYPICIFNVILRKSGNNFFTGYIYGNKLWGAGLYINYTSDITSFSVWKRSNGVDTFGTNS